MAEESATPPTEHNLRTYAYITCAHDHPVRMGALGGWHGGSLAWAGWLVRNVSGGVERRLVCESWARRRRALVEKMCSGSCGRGQSNEWNAA